MTFSNKCSFVCILIKTSHKSLNIFAAILVNRSAGLNLFSWKILIKALFSLSHSVINDWTLSFFVLLQWIRQEGRISQYILGRLNTLTIRQPHWNSFAHTPPYNECFEKPNNTSFNQLKPTRITKYSTNLWFIQNYQSVDNRLNMILPKYNLYYIYMNWTCFQCQHEEGIFFS